MKIKILLKRMLFVATVMGLSLLAGFVFYFVFFQSGINSGLEQFTSKITVFYEQAQASSAEFPIRIQIPKIKVDAAIEYVGITKDGAIGVPRGPVNAAWFKEGPRPGDPGSAIIDGHAGWKNGIPAVFDNLFKLKKGDKIYIKDKKGATIVFVVRKIKKYYPKAYASDLFVSSDGVSHLNLITCTGIWNVKEKTHSQRLVVFADKEI